MSQCKLHKSLYGMERIHALDMVLEMPHRLCYYINNDSFIILLLYVENMSIADSCIQEVNKLKI